MQKLLIRFLIRLQRWPGATADEGPSEPRRKAELSGSRPASLIAIQGIFISNQGTVYRELRCFARLRAAEERKFSRARTDDTAIEGVRPPFRHLSCPASVGPTRRLIGHTISRKRWYFVYPALVMLALIWAEAQKRSASGDQACRFGFAAALFGLVLH